MKSKLIALINLIVNPVLFFDVTRWCKRLKYIPFKRIQYVLLSSNITLRGMNYKVKKYQAILALLVFEIDYYIDHFIEKDENYSINVIKLLENPHFSKIISDFLNEYGLQSEKFYAAFNKLLEYDLKASNAKDLNTYLSYSYYSVGVPLTAYLVGYFYKEEFNDYQIELAGNIVRILSDIATTEKDKQEGGKNILDFTDAKNANNILISKIKAFRNINENSMTSIFLHRLIGITLKLYKPNKDFQL